MRNQKLTQLAQIIIRQSLEVKPLEKIQIYVSTPSGMPLARAVYQEIIDVGAMPVFEIVDEESTAYYWLHANKDQLNYYPGHAEFEATYFDKFVQIIAPENLTYLNGADAKKMMARSVLVKPIKDIKLRKPWCLTYYPTPAVAQAAKMSLSQMEEFYFGAVLQDWRAVSKEMTSLANRLNKAKHLRFIGRRTDLEMETGGRVWNDTDWKCNLPGGEVFTTPVKTSVNGHIYFNFPLTHNGITMTDIELTFKKGKVTDFSASSHQDHLEKLLDTDAGARYLGEVAIGLNKGCKQYMDNILFDEKMAGTVHVALGESYPECGLDNRSALHLDIIKDMRGKNDQVLADGRVVMEGGRIIM
ncbi:aminopeptidase [Microgenomates group bacterium]|nr:aminopeptidase [Microgenomates group bacterium]